MPQLKPLPANVRNGAFELTRLSEKQSAFDTALRPPRAQLEFLPGGRRQVARVEKHLDAASAALTAALDSYRDGVRRTVRSYFARIGIVPGAIIELHYPVYQVTLIDDLTGHERLLRNEVVTLRVEAFTVERSRSPSDIVLAVVGYPKAGNGRFRKDTQDYRLQPGYEFKVIEPAP